MAKTTETPEKSNTEVAEVKVYDPNALPAYLQSGTHKVDDDNFDSSDVVLPRLKLLQSQSSEVKDYPDAGLGHFWHTGADLDIGDTFDFVVVSRKKKFLLMAPMDDGQGVLARADDAKTWDRIGSWTVKLDKRNTAVWEIKDTDVIRSGLTNWGTSFPGDENSPPAATLFYEYLVILPAFPELGPVIMSLARSAISRAKKGLNDKIEMHKAAGRPLQAIVFRARATADKNDSGQDFYNWQFIGGGFADEATYRKAVELSNTLTDYKVQDEGGAASEGTAAPATSNDY